MALLVKPLWMLFGQHLEKVGLPIFTPTSGNTVPVVQISVNIPIELYTVN